MEQNQIPSILREWAPLTDLFDKLPTKTGGIFSQDIKLTCLDVLSEFLALGTNVGVIFWYDRKRKDLQRLRCEVSVLACFHRQLFLIKGFLRILTHQLTVLKQSPLWIIWWLQAIKLGASLCSKSPSVHPIICLKI